VGLRTGLDVSEKTKLYPVPGIVKCDVMPTLNKSPPLHPPFIFLVQLLPNAGHGLVIHEVSRSHTTTRHSRCRTPLDE